MAEQKEMTEAERILHFVAQPRVRTKSEQQFEMAELCEGEMHLAVREDVWHMFTWIYRLDDGSAILMTENMQKAIPDVEAVDLMEESRKLYRYDQRLWHEERQKELLAGVETHYKDVCNACAAYHKSIDDDDDEMVYKAKAIEAYRRLVLTANQLVSHKMIMSAENEMKELGYFEDIEAEDGSQPD